MKCYMLTSSVLAIVESGSKTRTLKTLVTIRRPTALGVTEATVRQNTCARQTVNGVQPGAPAPDLTVHK